MDAKTYLEKQIKSMWYLQDSVLKGLTDEHLSANPIGTTSSIGIIWLHMVFSEDAFVSMILDQSRLWKADGWNQKFGLEKAPNIGEDWTEYQDANLTVDLLQTYMQVVRAQTQAGLDATTAETLDKTLKWFTESDPKADVWVLLAGHNLLHAGEIAALKGVLGEKGLPF